MGDLTPIFRWSYLEHPYRAQLATSNSTPDPLPTMELGAAFAFFAKGVTGDKTALFPVQCASAARSHDCGGSAFGTNGLNVTMARVRAWRLVCCCF